MSECNLSMKIQFCIELVSHEMLLHIRRYHVGLSGGTKEGSIWKPAEVSNVWGIMPVAGNTWGRNEDYSVFQGIGGGGKAENVKSYSTSGAWDAAGVGDQLSGKSFTGSASSDVWRGFQEYDPFKRSWGEVDFTAVPTSDKTNWGNSGKEIDQDKMADGQQEKSTGQSVHKSASLSEISSTLHSGVEVQSTASDVPLLSACLPIKSVSSGNFLADPITKLENERSQPDGAEVSQQNKEEIIAKMVNSHDGWGKKPIRQDTPWQTDPSAANQPQGASEANPVVAPANVIGW